MASVIPCVLCKKLYQDYGFGICHKCVEETDQSLLTIRDYLDENTTADIKQVSEDTGISEKIIFYLLKKGRISLNVMPGMQGGLRCGVCRKPIASGRICEKCRESMEKTLAPEQKAPASSAHEPAHASAYASSGKKPKADGSPLPRTKDGQRMHTYDDK